MQMYFPLVARKSKRRDAVIHTKKAAASRRHALIQARVSRELHEELHALASAQDLSLSQVLRRLCAAAVREARQTTPAS
jgi:hypothetical protein